jgi:predicted amidohydrolase YtcJ
MGIQGMVTRRGWDGKVWGANQRITVSEAIAVNTYTRPKVPRRRSKDYDRVIRHDGPPS